MALHDVISEIPSHTPGTAKGEERCGRRNRDRKPARRARTASDATGINASNANPSIPACRTCLRPDRQRSGCFFLGDEFLP